jgi:hypothetical protein
MRIPVAVLAAIVVLGCHKAKPTDLSSARVSYTTSPTQLTVKIVFVDRGNSFRPEGTLDVSLHQTGTHHEGGAGVCGGSAPITAASYDEHDEGLAAVILTGCPPLPRTIDHDIRVHFTPKSPDDFYLGDMGDEALTRWVDSKDADVPDDPVVARHKDTDKQLTDACAAKDIAKATAVRAKAAPEVTKAIESLTPQAQHAISALLTGPDPCKRFLTVIVHWNVTIPSTDDLIEGFPEAVRNADWPEKTIATPLVDRLTAIGAGWLVVFHDAPVADPDKFTGPMLAVKLTIWPKGTVSTEGGVPFPRLTLFGQAQFKVPPELDESIYFVDAAFEPAGQKFTSRLGSEAYHVVAIEHDQLLGKLDTSTILTPAADR